MPRTDEDFGHEIDAHLEIEAERLMAEGLTRQEAHAAARRRFGSVTRARERFFEARRLLWLDHLRQDARCAIRSIAKTPVTCAVAVASLAAGIGATSATLTVRNAIYYNPPPLYLDPEQLSSVRIGTPERTETRVTGTLFAEWSADADLARRIAAATPARPEEVRVGNRTETVRVRIVTPDLFELLGVQPSLGRSFRGAPASLPGEDATQGPSPLILSFPIWQTMFDGRDNVVGTIVWIEQHAYTVAGVMPERFWFGAPDPTVWTALDRASMSEQPELEVVVRRPEGLSAAVMGERLQQTAITHAARGDASSRQVRVLVSTIGGTALGRQIASIVPWLVGTAVLLTLLIACANVALLMFARWTAREREMAVTSCLGASRGRTLALLLTEAVVLALLGGALGVCATFVLRQLFVAGVPGAMNYSLTIDRAVLLQAAGVTLLAGILSGIGPAVYETRRLQITPLRLVAASERVRQRWRHALVMLEIAVTVALMIAAAAQIDASRRILTSDLGFEMDSLLVVRVENASGMDVDRVLETVRGVPGVTSAAAGTALPMTAADPSEPVTSAGGNPMSVSAERVSIGTDYFSSLGVPLRAGRTFTDADLAAHSRIAVVDDILATQLWPDREAISRRILLGDRSYEVIGVVAAYASSSTRIRSGRLFLPLTRDAEPRRRIELAVRTAAHGSRHIAGTVRQELRALGDDYAVPYIFSPRDVLKAGAGEVRLLAVMMSPLLVIGMFLTVTGIFGVLAFATARRSNELALRRALGANRASLARLVLAHALVLLAIGSLAGVAATHALTRLVRAAGGGGSSFDTPGWQAFALPVLIILTVGMLATWIPARRAMSVDPARLLKAE